MTIISSNPNEYIDNIDDNAKKQAIIQLRDVIVKNIPAGFEEGMQYNMIAYYVPHSLYPSGYHCDPKVPLPFINLAAQKNFIAIYHMGLYADPILMKWFTDEHSKMSPYKLDMGKSCIRYKSLDRIPFDLITELMKAMNPQEWISLYESAIKK